MSQLRYFEPMANLAELLQPIANQFDKLGLPEPIVHWGHPVMMGIVIFVMGSYVGWTGWQSRLNADKDVVLKSRAGHRMLAPWMFTFMALGSTGGLLSLVMQKQEIMQSPHFWTGMTLLTFLAINAVLSLNFGENKQGSRITHAYLGTVALGLMFLHAVLGLKLGLSI